MIEIENLRYSYPDGTRVLDGISLSVEKGEFLGIVGPNGAGKSTLLLHLNGILRGEGRVTVAGTPVVEDNLDVIRGKVGLVFQDPENQLFMPTVFEDVAFGPLNLGLDPGEVETRAREALRAVDMLDSIHRQSHHLSFGEKRRVALATVLSMRPEILALDEPSSNLDPRSRRHLIGVLEKIPATKIVAGHDLEMILDLCPRVVILDRGRITADGRAEEILGRRELLAAHGLEVPLSLQLKAREKDGNLVNDVPGLMPNTGCS